MSYIKPHLSPELRAQITPQNKRDGKLAVGGVFLLLASVAMVVNIWPESNAYDEAQINSKLESIGAQTPSVTFGNTDKQVLGASSADEIDDAAPAAAQASTPSSETTTASSPSSDQFTSYTVKNGDTLFNISQEYGIKWDLIAQFNNLSEPYLLHGGQVLKIPQSTTSSVPNKIYTIATGDTLTSIAKAYNITVNDIIAVNPNLQVSDLITVGQVIKLP